MAAVPVRPDAPHQRDAFHAYDVGAGTPLVIDNGSYRCRAGWATDASPRFECINASARYRQRREGDPLYAVGGDIPLTDWSRITYRTPFEANVVVNFDSQELVLDHVFSHLSVASAGRVDHPIVMTEAVCNPNHCREGVSELLFECYNVPSVAYTLDAVCSYYHAQEHPRQQRGIELTPGLIVSASHRSTHVIPVAHPQHSDAANTKRINLGGLNLISYLQRLLLLKHPTVGRDVTFGVYENLLHDHCYVATDYAAELAECTTRAGLARIERAVQLPFNMQLAVEKSAEEKERAQQRRREHAARLQQLAANRRTERLKGLEDTLTRYAELVDSKQTMTRQEFQEHLQALDFKTEAQLQEAIKLLQGKVRKTRAKQQGVEEPEEDKEEKFDFGLLEIPDADLTDEQIKEKRKVRLIKSGMDARERVRQVKLAEQKERAATAERDERLREQDFDAWRRHYMEQRQALLDRIRERKRRREQLADRRSAASVQRMRSIAALAENPEQAKSGGSHGRKRKAPAAIRGGDDDTFGADDNDWLVYREISKEEESDEEEDELTQLAEIETALSKHDPDFDADSASYGQTAGVLSAFLHGPGDGSSIGEQYQLHLNVERIRVPEILFQPPLAGVDQTGLAQTIQSVLAAYSQQQQAAMCRNVYLTGGVTLTPGFEQRVRSELVSMRPFGSEIRVHRGADPLRDAWRGARLLASQANTLKASSITRAQYLELGHDYLVEHALSNRFHRVPLD
eukprot:Unigene14440_Nuclearia_a/m.43538 Unigene14440_Nuclearia_a/g.43538  ORF Unigene14440_Nuclearia_a/g.43538 Unigene14440_Nuclearia_a/m.43538 type:complete len:742 (+) Unigene14440_Nuclearia_a:21-2246(+)